MCRYGCCIDGVVYLVFCIYDRYEIFCSLEYDTTDTNMSASYLDLHLKIDSEGRLRTKLFDKTDGFNFPIENFRFIRSTVPAAPAYGV